jgi:hypothetical protein
LDWAIDHGIENGGWCPKGRLAEDGMIDLKYQLRETQSEHYIVRTERNVLDSDGTLIVNLGELEGGSLQTLRLTKKHQKPCLVLQLDEAVSEENVARVLAWLRTEPIRTLNIAGPRESERPGIYQLTQELLSKVAIYESGEVRHAPARSREEYKV